MQHLDLMGSFPYDRHPHMRVGQRIALEHLKSTTKWPVVHQSPVGTGKTDLGYTFLKAKLKQGSTHLLYATPTKTQVEQVQLMLGIVYGRYLGQYARAKQHLEAALPRLFGDREREMAQAELARVQPLAMSQPPAA